MTMADYIDRQEVIKKLEELDSRLMRGHYADECAGVTMANSIVQNVPAADVKPVVHGHWKQVDETKCRCSNCDIIALIGLYPHGDKNYCPNCGAKMDKEEPHD